MAVAQAFPRRVSRPGALEGPGQAPGAWPIRDEWALRLSGGSLGQGQACRLLNSAPPTSWQLSLVFEVVYALGRRSPAAWPAPLSLRRRLPRPQQALPGSRLGAQGWSQLSQRMGQKKKQAEAEQQQSPTDTTWMPSSKKSCLRPPLILGSQYSIYFSQSPKAHCARLGSEFFDQPAVSLARAFLGQVLVRRLGDGTELRGCIVETEAYVGPEDEAAHSRGGRQTPRNRSMFMKPGTLYVYLIYGMYFCMNVSSQGDGACVLLRALEPLGGLETMRQLRSTLRKGTISRALKDRELCSGPSKLCQALAIDKSFDQRDLAQDEAVWLERGSLEPSASAVVAAARIGIGCAGEWAQKPLRFYIRGSPWVSVVDKVAEQDTQA
ncbi:DNA-3-methyladenine glycosylase [Heterocephalus glaber]|uniref:DNA-3-methyladenine glycosylase n=1 Tax=Heterocephalus glaber TaxID=10181 RepID=A0AAX6QRR1_HETGA|nr:DNA-3-methyladenine glycosylase [Heterocephalus glaber]